MTNDCGAFSEPRGAESLDTRTLVDFLKASAIVAVAVTLALIIPSPDAGTTDENAFLGSPFGSALSLRAALPPGQTLSGESATFSIVEAPSIIDAPLPPSRSPGAHHLRPRNRIEPVTTAPASDKIRKAHVRRVVRRRQETPLTIIARAADALAMDIRRGLQQLPVRISKLFSGRHARVR